jgi:hypothetical protein
MIPKELQDLIDRHAEVVEKDAEARKAELVAKNQAAAMKVAALSFAYEEKVVDGKNAEIRKMQEQGALAVDSDYQSAATALEVAECDAIEAAAELAAVAAEVSLTRAYLYSQCKIE